MKKTLHIFLFLPLLIYGQINKKELIKKSFITNIGTVCEEVMPPTCAGYEKYLVLDFRKEDVLVIEKDISTCDKEEIQFQRKFRWKLIGDVLKINEIEATNSFLKEMTLKLTPEGLIGTKKIYSNKISIYKFEEIKKDE